MSELLNPLPDAQGVQRLKIYCASSERFGEAEIYSSDSITASQLTARLIAIGFLAPRPLGDHWMILNPRKGQYVRPDSRLVHAEIRTGDFLYWRTGAEHARRRAVAHLQLLQELGASRSNGHCNDRSAVPDAAAYFDVEFIKVDRIPDINQASPWLERNGARASVRY